MTLYDFQINVIVNIHAFPGSATKPMSLTASLPNGSKRNADYEERVGFEIFMEVEKA